MVAFSIFMRQRVEHRMVRMYTGQSIPFQLFTDDMNNLFHARIIICPVANDLQTVRKVAVGVRKIRLQFQGRAIALNRFGNVSAVLVHARKITVRVGERRVDLNRARVTLERALHIVHLFQSVAHVAVCVGKVRLDADRLLVVHQRLVELALLLQN